MKEKKSADEVLREKREERGWDEKSEDIRNIERIAPLPLSLEEYKFFCLLLSKLALQDQNSEYCEMYFELQRRATYGNHYPLLKEMAELEQEMWSLGTGEIIEQNNRIR